MYYVYVIKSRRDRKRYTGITDSLERRVSEHNRSKSSTPSTKPRGSFNLLYFEEVKSRKEARAREKYLKSGSGREFLDTVVVAQR